MIKQHYQDEDMQLLFFKEDFNRWNNEADLINDEISFFNGMFISDFIKKLKIDFYSAQSLNADLLDFELKHGKITEELKQFKYKTEGVRECDDLQCEYSYINCTVDFKTKMENHMGEFRILKKEILGYLKNGLQNYIN